MGLADSALSSIVHPRIFDSLEDFYPSEVTIQAAAVTQRPNGEQVVTWSDFLTGIRGNLATATQSSRLEQRGTAQTTAPAAWSLSLDDYYPAITVLHRVVIGGTAYNITAVHHDSLGESTRLQLERTSH
jgi:hypothetical protein